MSLSTPFIHRPVGTTLLTIAIGLAGVLAYMLLPVAPLPQVDYPSVSVFAALPGASPETMASSVATPLERQFGRIAGVTEMTSTSSLGNANITLVFDLNRDIDAASRDVQAAINAARGQLPANLPSNPSYRKVNPADAPIMLLSITSEVYDRAQIYDAASSILAQKLSQVNGVGQVRVGGGALPAVRVEINPTRLNNLGVVLEDVRTVLGSANANRPKGQFSGHGYKWTISTTDQLFKADEYKDLIVAYRNGAAVRLADIADVVDSVEDIRTGGLVDGKPATLIIISREPGANIIQTVDAIKEVLPQLQAEIPAGMKLTIASDRTVTIRASFYDVQRTLLISICLVVMVVFVFLRDVRTTFIPSVAVPISLLGTFGVMYLCGYTLDNLSLMAVTIATGFVVDDAIVVIENITRHIEQGIRPMQAALLGAGEVGFTVVSMSTSLVAVFIPILLMGGYIGRLFREFAVTLSVAIGMSMIISLTATPMMCAHLLKSQHQRRHGRLFRFSEWAFDRILKFYEITLAGVLRHPLITLLITLSTIGFTVYLYTIVPTGLFPQQDTARINGRIVADQSISFQAMTQVLKRYSDIVARDPAVDMGTTVFVGGFGGAINIGTMFINLKPIEMRPGHESIDQVIARMRRNVAVVPGATLLPQAFQDIRVGGRQTGAQYQFTLQGDDLNEVNQWAPQVLTKLLSLHGVLADVNSTQQNRGLQANLVIDRETASRMGITSQLIDNTLYDAFGQRQVSTMYETLNQYHVVMEVSQDFWQNPDGLKYIYIRSSGGGLVPLSAFTHFERSTTSLGIDHSGQFPSVTISFNLPVGVSLGDAVAAVDDAMRDIRLPADMRYGFSGTAQAFQAARAGQLILIFAAIATVYIVLGILYESYIHPITILSTLPSAGVGALLAILVSPYAARFFHVNISTDLNVIAMIGIILLIGIVKKNAIMMIDFALEAERSQHLSPRDAIFQASLLRFRPITMTTMAALLGGLPLALGTGTGAELRRPLGIAIVGGLVFSQLLTLYTTPVVYLYLDRLRLWLGWALPALWSLIRPRRRFPATPLVLLVATALCLTSASCTVGPNYKRPDQKMPTTYKSSTTQESTTQPALARDWWKLFSDPTLNTLEESAIQSNTDLQQAMARVIEARDAAAIVNSGFYPTISFDPSFARSRSPGGGGSAPGTGRGGGSNTGNTFRIPFDLTYEVDVWGKIRRNSESAQAQLLASEYAYEVVLQTLEADVAQDYFNYRSLALQEQILARTVESFRQQVQLTQTQLNAGLVGPTDAAQATAQLQSAIAQQIDLERQLRDTEHAIAILLGRSPAEISMDSRPLDLGVPAIPSGLPAELLRRRPDIAQAEQNLVSANAQIGVAESLFYPAIQLTGSAGFESFDVRHALDWQQRIWSIGSSAALPIFEGGQLHANLDQAKAKYQELNAAYRGSVLAAIRDVEDSLTDLHLRADQAVAQQQAVQYSRDYLQFSQTQYRQGLIGYLQVIDAERTLLSNELLAAQILDQRLISTVLLIKAVGGGWEPHPVATTRP